MAPTFSSEGLYDGLVSNGLIIPVGVQGLFGRGAVFEKVLRAFDEHVSRVAAEDGAEQMLFPPTLDRRVFEKSEFLDSFPQLAGTVFSWHQDHFGEIFDIKTPDGAVANTACLGFGLERVCMALFSHHGFNPKLWPKPVREALWP